MTKIRPSLLFLVLTCFLISRCNAPLISQPITYYIDVYGIQKVEMNNVNGKFVLNEKQLERFKYELSTATTVPNLTIKTGALTIIITLNNGRTYVIRSSSASKFLEISSEAAELHTEELSSIKWLVLNTNGVNFNNYRKR